MNTNTALQIKSEQADANALRLPEALASAFTAFVKRAGEVGRTKLAEADAKSSVWACVMTIVKDGIESRSTPGLLAAAFQLHCAGAGLKRGTYSSYAADIARGVDAGQKGKLPADWGNLTQSAFRALFASEEAKAMKEAKAALASAIRDGSATAAEIFAIARTIPLMLEEIRNPTAPDDSEEA